MNYIVHFLWKSKSFKYWVYFIINALIVFHYILIMLAQACWNGCFIFVRHMIKIDGESRELLLEHKYPSPRYTTLFWDLAESSINCGEYQRMTPCKIWARSGPNRPWFLWKTFFFRFLGGICISSPLLGTPQYWFLL